MLSMKYLLALICIAALIVPGQAQEPAKKNVKKIIRYEPEKEKHYKLLPLGVSSFEAVSPIIKAMMSQDGILTNEPARKSVLIYDTDEVIAKVSDFLRQLDINTVNIRVDIEFAGGSSTNNDAIIVRPDSKNKKSQKNDVKLISRKTNTTTNTSQFILTKSGSPASIWAGKTIVDPSWLRAATKRPDIVIVTPDETIRMDSVDTDIKWVNVGASLEVLPTYYPDDTIDVEVYPTVSCLDGKGRRQTVKVQQLATKVRVKNGQKIFIGGMISGKSNDYFSLFGPDFFSRRNGVDATNIYLTATAVNSGGGILNSAPPRK